MSELVHVKDLRPGDVVVLSGGVVATIVAFEGGRVLVAKGAAASIGVRFDHADRQWVYRHELVMHVAPDELRQLLVLHRGELHLDDDRPGEGA